jgi:hypothetical protein
VPAAVEKWFPGTKPTADEIEAAQRTHTDVMFPPKVQQYQGAPHAVSQ